MWLTRDTRERRDTYVSVAAFVVSAMITCILVVAGLASSLEYTLRDGRDQLRIAPASGEIVVVEIDGRSLAELETWPWPRSYHAQAVRDLERLGAEQIAFDVDFSARSTPEQDAALAAALAEVEQPVILPTFRQLNQAAGPESFTESAPIPELRENAFLASVNVAPSGNGRVLFYPNGVVTDGTARPSLANMLARSNGAVGETFRVDQAIDIESIPRVSFIDLVEGRTPAEQIDGKRVVIGATAIELFDRYPTALFGVQPGVLIQVQAAETLLQDRARGQTGPIIPLVLVASLLLAVLLLRKQRGPRTLSASWSALFVGLVLVGGALVLDQASGVYVDLVAACVFLLAFAGARRILTFAATLEAERMTDIATGLLNRKSLQKSAGEDDTIAVACFPDFAEVGAMLAKEQLVELELEVARRLELGAGGAEIHRIGAGFFGWSLARHQASRHDDTFVAIRALFNSAFELAQERLKLTPHFGVAEGNVEAAIGAARYSAKKNRVWSSDASELRRSAQYTQRLLGELDGALEDGSIVVKFQPKVDLASDSIVGAECLVRWKSRQLGPISPGDFIPILEERGRIAGLTNFVVDEAIARLTEASAAGIPLNLAVNISAQLLSDGKFIAGLLAKIEMAELGEQTQLTLEITESAPFNDPDLARDALEQLVEAGARISIDDYGTGQATLTYLQGFPAHELKLDQSFVRGLASDRRDRIMVQSTIELAHALGFEVVGEGVESREVLAILQELGCDFGQGWYLGKPVTWGELMGLLRDRPTSSKAA